jgi:hypothetical protein
MSLSAAWVGSLGDLDQGMGFGPSVTRKGATVEEERRSFAASDDVSSVEEVEVPPDIDPEVIKEAVRAQRTVSIIGYVVGGIAVLAGIAIFALGLSEAIEWEIEGFGLSSKVQTSAAGVVIAIIGLLVIMVSRFSVRIRSDEAGGGK